MKKHAAYLLASLLLVASLARAQNEKVMVLVNAGVYAQLEPEILRYIDDISTEYKVSLFETSGGTPYDLKEIIKANADSLAGCILIGRIPAYWFEIEQDEAANNAHTIFPCDLYFMDLDGLWTDADSDGTDDTHTGHVAPEIFLARIDASYFGSDWGNETALLREYLDRDHNYWTGSYSLRKTGLAYTDDDWKNYSPINEELRYLYGSENFQVIKDDRISRKDYLLNRLSNNQYEFVQVAVHSNASVHVFNGRGAVYMDDIRNVSSKAVGYNLFACSACDFTQPCLGNAYLFHPSEKSLVAVGSTKIGSMLQFYAFYQPLGQNKPMGQAYREWFNWIAPFSSYEISWHYGMTLLGDPLIRLNPDIPNHGPLADIGDGEDILWPGNTTEVAAIVRDDDLPSAHQFYHWEKVSGPGSIVFDHENEVATPAHFSEPGDYRIRFTSSDGQFVAEDFKNIKVTRIKWQGEIDTAFGQQNALVIRDSIAFELTSDVFYIIDISDKSSPEIVQFYDFPETMTDPYINDLAVDSGYAYLAQAENGLKVISITDFRNPHEVAAFSMADTEQRYNAVKVAGNYLYIADNEKGLIILDVRDRIHPILSGYCPTEGPALALAVQGNFAYIADGFNGLRIIDISDKQHPFETGYFALKDRSGSTKQSLQVQGNYAFLGYGDSWNVEDVVSIIDISDKTNPVEIGRLEGPLFTALHVEGNYLYYSAWTIYDKELFGIYDITDKSTPQFIESYIMERIYFQDTRNILANGPFVYVLDNVNLNALNIFRVQLPNTEPLAYAGDDAKICADSFLLKGIAFDDKLPADSVTFFWEKIYGPGWVDFNHPYEHTTQAVFSDSGEYAIRLTASDGDLMARDEIHITNLNKRPPTEDISSCEGSIVPELSTQGDSIRWYGDAGLTEMLGSGMLFSTGKTQPGSYRYYVTQVISGCESSPDSAILTIYPLPMFSLGKDSALAQNQTLILGVEVPECTYLWSDGSGESFYEFRGMDRNPGIYDLTLTVTDSNTCQNSDTVRIQVLSVTEADTPERLRGIQCYPNPTSGQIAVKLQSIASDEIMLVLVDQQGTVIQSESILTVYSGMVLTLDLSSLVPGIYFLKISSGGDQIIQKILLK